MNNISKETQEFADKLFNSRLFKLAHVEAARRKIHRPNIADILELMSEIVARANEKEIQI